MRYVVSLSGGVGSYMAAKRVVAEHGKGLVDLVFADTMMEDEDLYRFLDAIERVLGIEVVRIADGRDPWQVFHDVRFLGNTRVDPCSRVLKRQLIRKWIEDNYEPGSATVIIGIDWTESHRMNDAIKEHWEPWTIDAPLTRPPYLSKQEMLAELTEDGIEIPKLYKLGFHHNNCGGFCIKAGQAQYSHLLKVLPERYAYHEQKEQELRDHLGKDVTILRDRRGGPTKPITLKAFRERIQAGGQHDLDEWGGCGCFTPDNYETECVP